MAQALRFSFTQPLAALCLTLALASGPVRAQSEASLALSALPVASVVGVTGVAAGSAVAGSAAVVMLPVAMTMSGAVLLVKTVEASARGTVWVLERASDGARVSVEMSGRAAGAVSAVAGTAVAVSVTTTGVMLSVAGEVLCFIPNELGRALLHNQRITH